MSKAILMSIRPKWVAKILNGEKTIEIRKTMPKCGLPIDVYIYCTKDKKYANLVNRGGFLTGMVVAKFTLNEIQEIRFDDKEIQKQACLTEDELFDYLFINEPYHEDMHKGYAIHITELEIFDKPKELSEFDIKVRNNVYRKRKAPQSWCYVEI